MSSLGNVCTMYEMVWMITVFLIDVTPREIDLPPNASWHENGTTVTGFANGTGGSSLYQLSRPFGLSISSNDILYISDMDNHRIVVVRLDSTINTSIIGSGSGSGLSQFNNPHDVITTDTSLYVLDTNNHQVQKLSLNGSDPTTVLSYNSSYAAHYFYVDHDANIYLSVAENHIVILYCSNSSNGTIVAGTGVKGSNNSELNSPHGVFVNRNGTIYIADRQNHRIMKWERGASSGICVAGNGTAGSNETQLNQPIYIVFDSNEYMYISENDNHRITRWAPNSTFGVCIAACTGKNGSAPNQLQGPHSIAFDSNGSLYVSEWDNNRVQKFQLLTNKSVENSTTVTPFVANSTIIPFSCHKQEISTTVISGMESTASIPTSSSEQTEATAIKQTMTGSTLQSPQTSSPFVPSSSPSYSTSNGKISDTLCDKLQPCQNGGTCTSISDQQNYTCSCVSGFTGIRCQSDDRPCQNNTCWNNGTCYTIFNTTFNCTCVLGWEGDHCERMIDYCFNITCQNRGVCRRSLLKYTCVCLSGYSGEYCETTTKKLAIYQMVSTSFSYVAIIAMGSVVMFVVIMDILKYCFGIDPVEKERRRMRRAKRAKKRKPIIQRFVYVNAPSSSEQATATIAETTI